MGETGKKKPGSIRIIGGEWRRQRIAIPAEVDLRPTPDRVRETLFNWLGPRIAGTECLDLFAGTGVLAFEALSRGAASAVIVERDKRAAEAIEATSRKLEAKAEIVCADAIDYLQGRGRISFDVIFVDPPYADPAEPILRSIAALARPAARIYLERPRGAAWPELPEFHWLRRATAGSVEYGLAETVG